MSVDKPEESNDIKGDSGGRSEHVNGVQNGYVSSDKYKSSHKSSSKDKHRDKDRDHKSSSSKHSSSSSSRDKDKDRHSSSKSSSHKSSNRDKERGDNDKGDRNRSDKDHKSSDRSKPSGDSSKDKDRSDKDRSDRHKSSSSSHDKDKKHSSSSKDKSSSSSSRDKSSSSSKDKNRSRSERDRSEKDRDKEKHRSDRDKHSTSSKDKRSSNESSRDKDKSSRDKSSHSDKHNSSSRHKSSESPEKKDVKQEVAYNQVHGNNIKKSVEIKTEEVDVEEDYPEDPLATTVSSCDYSMSQFKDEPLGDGMDVDSEEDVPLSARKAIKRESNLSDSEEEKPLSARKKPKIEKKKIKQESDYDDDEEYSEEEKPKKKKVNNKAKVKTAPVKRTDTTNTNSFTNTKKKKKEETEEVWKWWEEEKKDDGTKWNFLEHKGPLFAPPYERLPKSVVFKYDGKPMQLSEETEEVAGFYAKMLDHDYTTKKVFNDNFFGDWRKVMTDEEKSIIKNLSKCDFRQMDAYFKEQSERNKNKSKEEKQALKLKNEEIQKEYGFCKIDGHKEKIGNFRIEPPGLFRGRGEHPKMGKLKQRVLPKHIIINCSKDSKIPKPPDGHKWKEVRHDNSVTWLASWTENVQGQVKYIMLNPSSKLKGEKDWQKYETARKLAKSIDKIRSTYREEWKAKEMRLRQRAVALYFIDRLALRAGNEKDEDQADTVGCCSLRVEHIELHKEKDGKEYVVVFDFLGKDSIRYYNEVPVEKRVFKNLELFKENKKEGDDLFDRLNTQIMNEHLRELMPNLTAKVFRTYNASFTLQNQLNELTDPDSSIEEKILAYNRANRAVAVLCNHQRAVPKGHQKSMEALKEKIQNKRNQIEEAEADLKDAMKQARKGSVKEKLNADKKKKALDKLRDQLRKLEVQETDRDENKTIALGTSKLNYLDPRISIAWCKKNGVPIEKIYNKTQRDKFRWAIDMATVDYVF